MSRDACMTGVQMQGCPLEPDAQGWEMLNLAEESGFTELADLIQERLQAAMPKAKFDPEVQIFIAA